MSERKHFIAIVVMIGVLTVLFQFSAIVKGTSLDYVSNHAVESAGEALSIRRDRVYDSEAVVLPDDFAATRRLVTFVGAKKSPYRDAAHEFATFAKWRFAEVESLTKAMVPQEKDSPKGIYVIDPTAVSWPGDIKRLRDMQKSGFAIVICSLPDEALIEKSDELQSYLGIAKVREQSVELTGFHLFEGLLLGGAKVYRNTPVEEHLLDGMDLEVPWYVMAGGSKVYLRGEVDTDVYPDAYAHDEIIPPLMWRFSEGNAPLFVAYGPILSRPEGFGLLTAFVAESTPFEAWPVANAQVLALNDYPVLAKENDEEMQRIYARDSISLQRDVVWGSISSLASTTGMTPTFLLAPELDERPSEQPNPDLLRFYLRSIDELGGEMGLACDSTNELSLLQKLQDDAAFLHGVVSEYKVSVAGVREEKNREDVLKLCSVLEGVHTVITLPREKVVAHDQKEAAGEDDSSVVGFLSDTVMRLSTTSNCWNYTALDDMALRACETGFGYSCVTFDLKGLTHPENKEDEWQEGYRKMLANYNTYWEPFRSLRQVSATTCDGYVRKALSSDCACTREGNEIVISCKVANNVEGQCFFLRLHDEHVVSVSGGSSVLLENGFYLIRLNDAQATVEVASDMQPTVVR
jgi:hypothetical protein